MRPAGERARASPARRRRRRLPVDAPVECDGRVDAEQRAVAGRVRRSAPCPRVRADERDRVGVRRVVLLVGGRDDVERDPQLLEDRAALRRGRGEDERGHAALPRDPDLLGRPLRAHSAETRRSTRGRRLVGRVELDEIDDLEARSRGAGGTARRAARCHSTPISPGHSKRPRPRCGRSSVASAGAPRPASRGSRACCCGGRRAARPAEAAGAPRGSSGTGRTRCWRRTPRTRGRSLVGQRHVLGARLDERELEPVLLLAAARGLELGRRHVDADRPRAAPREPGREVGRAAAELDDVEAVDVAERAERRPRGRRRCPR